MNKILITGGAALDCRTAEAELGWQPKVNLEGGLKETIAYFQKTLLNG